MRVLVTGASSGIGRAIAMRFARSGTRLALCASKDSLELRSIASAASEHGAAVIPLTGDLAMPEVAETLVGRAADEFGGLDVIVSNAGVVTPALLSELTVENWNRIFAINVRGPWLLARSGYPSLKASRGCFIAVSSMSGVEPYPGTGAYSASKAALIMLVRQLAQEWAGDGIRVNCVSPGLFRTAMTAPIYADPAKTAAREALVPMHRIGDPARDCAGVVEFLASQDAGYLTGQNIVIDGGLLDSIQAHLAGRPRSGGKS